MTLGHINEPPHALTAKRLIQSCRFLFLFWVCALLAAPPLSIAQTDALPSAPAENTTVLPIISITADRRDLWLIRNADRPQQFRVLHSTVADHPEHPSLVLSLHGSVAPSGLASSGGRLWLVYQATTPHSGLAVQSIRVPVEPTPHPWQQLTRIHPSLPAGVELVSIATSDQGPWAILSVQSEEALAKIDPQAPTPQPTTAPNTIERPIDEQPPAANEQVPSLQGSAKDQSTPDDAGTAENNGADAQTDATRQPKKSFPDRLLELERDQWIKRDLPDQWPHGSPAWAVLRRPADIWPVLVTTPVADDPNEIWVFERTGGSWNRKVYRVSPPRSAGIARGPFGTTEHATVTRALAIDGQIIIAQANPTPLSVEVSLNLLRRGKTISLGKLGSQQHPVNAWSVLPVGQTIALLTADEQGNLTMTRIDLQGSRSAPVMLTEPVVNPFAGAAGYGVVIIVMILAGFAMIPFWRRDPAANRMALPNTLVLASLGQRGIAAIVDMTPCVAISLFGFGLEPAEFFEHWPGEADQWSDTLPGLTAIALFVAHTLITELITGKTLGKRLVGIQVVGLNGEQPDRWRLAARCLTKPFDLIAWLLLILPMVGPYRQRLGDLIARTVVVAPAPEPEQPKQAPDE